MLWTSAVDGSARNGCVQALEATLEVQADRVLEIHEHANQLDQLDQLDMARGAYRGPWSDGT
ncbi:hypothetical protein DB30_00677 [Enhygromyxa salina]|uniref:Uncharacterized protein n=1 Tax=Enhygromyxa salina TaxID=215803 RepID=A0A0C2DFJ8_9BACT|nr:hypothetical protein [Enhygromyxa salina]KIG18392.1 hypothetical protein DB30_00677 [Enhygromyxa salina]